MQFGDFYGHRTAIIENDHFRVDCLAEAGPRVVRLIPQWTGENLFAELPHQALQTPRGDFHFYGGHRLWRAPESSLRSHVPDDRGASFHEVQSGIRIVGAEEIGTGIRKTMTIQMSASQPFIIVKHKIENLGAAPLRLSPWAITMLRPKGIAILPQQVGNVDDDGLHPNRRFALWPYTRWDDPRLKLRDEFITVDTEAASSPMKLGYFNPHGWLGYVFNNVMFVKRFGVRRDEEYPDHGCNSEIYANALALELETLGPLVELAPKTDVVHTETWEAYNLDELPKELLGGTSLNKILEK